MNDIRLLGIFQSPETYDVLYFGSERGQTKYQSEVDGIDALVTKVQLQKRVLDVGCGTASHLIKLAQKGYTGHGIDFNQKMLDLAKAKSQNLPLLFTTADMRQFRLDESFPIVLCMYGAINYLSEQEDIVNAISLFYTHTTKNGLVIIDVRYAKNQPTDVSVEMRGDGLIYARQWFSEPRNSLHAKCKMVYIMQGRDGFIATETHLQNYCDPFFIKPIMESVGFKDVGVYDNFDFRKRLESDTSVWRTVLMGRK